MTETIGWITTFLAVAGVCLNNRQHRACFYFWIISNSLSAILHGQAGMISLVVRDLIFLYLATEGIRKWRNIESIKRKGLHHEKREG